MWRADIVKALGASVKDDAVARHFLVVWPVIEAILEAFSKANELPIFVYLNEEMIYHSPLESMPEFCRLMLSSEETGAKCVDDGRRRAAKLEPDFEEGVQLCHAGLLNGRREIDTGVGLLVILFGAKTSAQDNAAIRRRHLIEITSKQDAELSGKLEESYASHGTPLPSIDSDDVALMDAISTILQRLLSATVGFRTQTINMAHELSLMMIGMGLLMDEMNFIVNDVQKSTDVMSSVKDLIDTQARIYTQCRLGLYIVRNFLSHASETRYSEVVRSNFSRINLKEILLEMVDLHRLYAAQKGVSFDVSGVDDIPQIYGSDMEIRRLLYNVLNNAIKYSYHSIPNIQRTIKIRSKVPYDPGFKQRRFSIAIENYGFGLTREEKINVFKPGVRGQRAIAEVPIGSGIGLSEALKIIKAHKGEIRLHSKELYEDKQGVWTYLTTVDLIFPYAVDYHTA
ncbi:MAG TPA: ATP-binding protein [Pyrinomonadaceae bacterium]|jgi:signal transduction histidine kinase